MCVTPLFREYEVGTNKTVRIVPREEVLERLDYDPYYMRDMLKKFNYKTLDHGRLTQMIDCGHCWQCRLNKAADWGVRCMLETLEHDCNYFVTLTYDDDHVPIASQTKFVEEFENGEQHEIFFDNEGDEIWCTGTLLPDEITLFLKRLRSRAMRPPYNHIGIRYFYCGEYGSENQRPHWHLLLFNCPLCEIGRYDTHNDENSKEHWKSELIEEIWENKGIIDIAYVEFSNASYVARYTTKKLDYKEPITYYMNGKEPEFVRMSRRPGLGMKYYQEKKHKLYDEEGIIVKKYDGSNSIVRLPKAFDKVFKEEYPDKYREIKKRRLEKAEQSKKILYSMSDYNDLELLMNKADQMQRRGAMLKREL